MQVYIIGIVHDHAGEDLSTTLGKLEAESCEDAVERASLWIWEKMEENNCKNCFFFPRESIGPNAIGLLASAEEIITSDQE